MPAVTVQRQGLVCTLAPSPPPQTKERLGDFLAGSPAVAYTQTGIWPEIAPVTKLQHLRYLWCEDSERLLLAGVARFTRLFPGYVIAALARGPVVYEPGDLDRCLPIMMDVFHRAGVSTLLVDPFWSDKEAEHVSGILAHHGFRVVNRADQPSYMVTGYVDLMRSEEEIFAGFKSRCRRHIRRAERQGLAVRPVESERDIVAFDALFQDFARRKKLDVAGRPALIDQWRYVREMGGAFLLAEVDGRLVGGHVAFREGERAVWVTMASDDSPSDMPRSYNLLWEAMRCMKGAGCRYFDLAGLSPDGSEDEGQKNRDFFKLSFNPRRVTLVPTHVAALRPMQHALFYKARQAYRRSQLRRYVTPLLKR